MLKMDGYSEEYLLKWNSHNTEMISEFHDLCRDELFTDVTVAAEDETFEAHKLVLSACSPYFKQMFTKTPCKHPVIFLKDVSANQMAILLKYMYLGQISVKKEELNSILKVADSLQIRGLTTNVQVPPVNDDLLMMTENVKHHHDNHQVIHATFGSSKPSRKGYLPKRLRTSGDSVLTASSPRLDSLSPSTQRDRRISEESSDQHEKASNSTPSQEEVEDEDQPVDFSQSRSSPDKPRYSILSNYLKTGKIGSARKSPSLDADDASISKAAESLAASWLEQSLTAMQGEEKDGNGNTRTTIPLRDTLGLDIADRLRSHFLSSIPTQSYNWSSSNNSGSNSMLQNGNSNALSPASMTGKPSVSCEICGKKLADPSSLYRHRKIHSGDKPHKCPYCTRRFIQRYNMKQHIKTHRLERMTEREKAEYLPKSARMAATAETLAN